MKYKSPTREVIRVVLDGMNITKIGPEWVELDDKWKKACLGAGCISEDMVKNFNEQEEMSKEDHLRAVIVGMLAEADIEKFGVDGIPKVAVVQENCDFKVTKKMISNMVMEIDNDTPADGEVSS